MRVPLLTSRSRHADMVGLKLKLYDKRAHIVFHIHVEHEVQTVVCPRSNRLEEAVTRWRDVVPDERVQDSRLDRLDALLGSHHGHVEVVGYRLDERFYRSLLNDVRVFEEFVYRRRELVLDRCRLLVEEELGNGCAHLSRLIFT